MQQKSSNLCDKRISSEAIRPNFGEVLVVITRLAPRLSVPLRQARLTSRGSGYVGVSTSIWTVISPNDWRRERAFRWVLWSLFFYGTSKSNLLRRICQCICLAPGSDMSRPYWRRCLVVEYSKVYLLDIRSEGLNYPHNGLALFSCNWVVSQRWVKLLGVRVSHEGNISSRGRTSTGFDLMVGCVYQSPGF